MMIKFSKIVLALLLFFISSGPAIAALVDFEGLGLNNGDYIPSIGVASFTASATRQGTEYAFISSAGDGTGWLPPFNAIGNTFITNPGGLESTSTKTIRISFSVPVYNFSFFAADIDSAYPTVEQLTATVYDASGSQINRLIHTASSSNTDDGSVVFFDFGGTAGIRSATISLINLDRPTILSGIGFGVDNLEFQIVPQPVPLPSSSLLFGTGLAGLIGYLRLKTQRRA